MSGIDAIGICVIGAGRAGMIHAHNLVSGQASRRETGGRRRSGD